MLFGYYSLDSTYRMLINNTINVNRVLFLGLCLTSSIFSHNLFAAAKQPVKYEDEDLMVRLIFRTPEQLEAFYIGRGFSKKAIRKIQETCFVTAIIKNKSIDVLWLDLNDWSFSNKYQQILHITRDYWKKQWQEVNMPLNHQSTFGWTLLPDVRDLRHDESVGGNVAIPRQSGPFDLMMRFKTGSKKNGQEKKIIFRDLKCGIDKP